MSACLALNASYEPLSTMPLKRALRLIIQGKAEVVESDPTRTVRSERQEFPRPVVIRLVKMVKVPQRFRRKVTNTFLFARDGYTCQYCGKQDTQLKGREVLNRDHVQPKSKGGENTWENCVTACSTCNSRKDNKTLAEAHMKLRSVPTVPNLVHLKWNVRRLTPMQAKYITMFYGEETVRALR